MVGYWNSRIFIRSFKLYTGNRKQTRVESCLGRRDSQEMGHISNEELLELAEPLKKNGYGQYLIAE